MEGGTDGVEVSTRLTGGEPGRVTVQALADGAFSQVVAVVVGPSAQGEMPDEYEPDDGIGSASAIFSDGEAQPRTFHHRDDVDWIAVEMMPGFRYAVTVGNGAPVEVNAYGADGNLLGTLDDGDEFGPGSNGTQTLYFAVTAIGGWMGAYGIGVRSSCNATLILTRSTDTIAGDGLDSAEIRAEIRSHGGEREVADNSTRIEFRMLKGEGLLSVETATVNGGVAKTSITSRAPDPLVVEARADRLPSTALSLAVTSALALDLHLAPGDQGIRESLTPPESGGVVRVDLAALSGAVGILGFQARITHDPRILAFTDF